MARKGKKHQDLNIEDQNKEPKLTLDSFFDKNGFWLLLGALVLVSFYVFKDYILLKNVYLFKDIGSDTINAKWPTMAHIADYIRKEGIPTWSFGQGMGQNIFSSGLKNPLNWITLFTTKDNIPYVIAYSEILKVVLGGIIFYLYLKLLDVSEYASIIGGILFAFSGYVILGGGWYIYSTKAVLVAFLLYSFELFLIKNKWYLFPWAVFLLASTAIYFFGIFLILYSVFRVVNVYGNRFKEYVLFYLKTGGLALLGIILSLPFFINNIVQIFNSPRVSGSASQTAKYMAREVFGLEGAHHYITVMMRFFSNDILGTGMQFKGWFNYLEAPTFYCGLLSLILLPQLFTYLTKRERLIYGSYFGLWTLIVVFPYFRYAYSLFHGDYYKTAISLTVPITVLLFSVLALSKIDRLKKINIPVLIGTSVFLLALLYYPYSFSPAGNVNIKIENVIESGIQLKVTFFILVYSVILLLYNKSNFAGILKLLLLLVVVVEMASQSSVTVNNRNVISSFELNTKKGYNDYTLDALEFIKSKDSGFYRVNKDYFSGPAVHASLNDALIQGFYGTMSYRAQNQGNYIKFLEEVGAIQKGSLSHAKWSPGLTRPILKIFGNVKYHLTKKDKPDQFTQFTYEKTGTFSDVSVYRNKFFLPFGHTYSQYISKESFDKLKPIQKDIALLKSIVVYPEEEELFSDLKQIETKTIPKPKNYTLDQLKNDIDQLKFDTLLIIKHSNKKILGTINLKEPKALFFSIPFDHGWNARVNGEKAEIIQTNIGFSSVMLPDGNHSVELHYKLPYQNILILISIFSVLVYTGLLLYSNKKNPLRASVYFYTFRKGGVL
ncbi:MAG: YfhO family protein [Ignavibacteriae bacterium]|nr:YfhO family protein [Ignavibacteriota bacterium]